MTQKTRRRLAEIAASATKRCRHADVWIGGDNGAFLWCYRCGAIRIMRCGTDIPGLVVSSKWQRPVGAGAENPAGEFTAAIKRKALRLLESGAASRPKPMPPVSEELLKEASVPVREFVEGLRRRPARERVTRPMAKGRQR